ncbi:MAG TPA: hypothetical protein VN282_17565 [Pyrinomonadaceae bacterium]|nr:hypothetical protein [Pyrinomonadaceae bacterium]
MSEEYDQSKGGGQWGEDDGPNIRYDDFVGRIVRDPNEPPCLTLLSGYLGSSSEEGHVRLYLDEELCRYVEIPEKAIRHTQELPPEQSPLGGSLVWIDRDAEVMHGAAGSERRKATFLEGQIAQDYIGGGGSDYASTGITTQTKDCRAPGENILPTDMGPGCGTSRVAACYPQPTQQAYCRTLTGILCTRFGPLCRRTIFEPVCTFAGPLCGRSVYYPCFTKTQPYCYESGPEDWTIYEQPGAQEQFGRQAAFAGGGAAGGAQGFVAAPPPTAPIVCPSQFVPCRTFGQPACEFGIVSLNIPCPPPTRSGPRCGLVSRIAICSDTRTGPGCLVGTAFGCVSRDIRCPTVSEPRCRISAVAFCPDTVAGCQVDSAFCGFDPGQVGFDPAAGGGAQARAGQVFEPAATQSRDCTTQTSGCHGVTVYGPRCQGGGVGALAPSQFCPSRVIRCPSAVDACPTRIGCPSRYIPCQSQFNRCPSALDACPTRYNCPTQPDSGCPGPTQFGPCETFGQCPSAVDACPTRFGCEVSQFCGESVACFPGGGGGGFDPGF